MTVKDLIKELNQYDENEEVWFHHKLIGKIMPAEIAAPIDTIKLTADGITLSCEKG